MDVYMFVSDTYVSRHQPTFELPICTVHTFKHTHGHHGAQSIIDYMMKPF